MSPKSRTNQSHHEAHHQRQKLHDSDSFEHQDSTWHCKLAAATTSFHHSRCFKSFARDSSSNNNIDDNDDDGDDDDDRRMNHSRSLDEAHQILQKRVRQSSWRDRASLLMCKSQRELMIDQDNNGGGAGNRHSNTRLMMRSYPDEIPANCRLQSSPALIRATPDQHMPKRFIPQEFLQLRHQKSSRPRPLSVDPSIHRITASTSSRRNTRHDVSDDYSEESEVIRAVQENLALRSFSPCRRRRPKHYSQSGRNNRRQPKDSTFRVLPQQHDDDDDDDDDYNASWDKYSPKQYSQRGRNNRRQPKDSKFRVLPQQHDDDDDDDNASWDKYRKSSTKKQTSDATTTEESSSLFLSFDEKAMAASPYPSVIWIPDENEESFDTMDSDHRRGRDRKKSNPRSRSKAATTMTATTTRTKAAAALQVESVLDKENMKKQNHHNHHHENRYHHHDTDDNQSVVQDDNQSIGAQAAWHGSCHASNFEIPLSYYHGFDMLISSIRKPTPPRRREYNDHHDIPTAAVTAAAAAIAKSSRQNENNSQSTPPQKEPESCKSSSPASVVSVLEASGNGSSIRRKCTSSKVELMHLQQELKQIKEWTRTYPTTTTPSTKNKTENINNSCFSSSSMSKKNRVQFGYPMVRDVQYRPKTLPEEIPKLFFVEEELRQSEKDRANQIHEEQFEMIARKKSDGRTVVSVRYPTPPMNRGTASTK